MKTLKTIVIATTAIAFMAAVTTASALCPWCTKKAVYTKQATHHSKIVKS